jgi:hypothetical protein
MLETDPVNHLYQHRTFPRFSGICKRIKKSHKIYKSKDYLATQGIIFYHSGIFYASFFVTKPKSEFMQVSNPIF